ncbi:MAG: response regulator [Verrucomicrobiota bacterium]
MAEQPQSRRRVLFVDDDVSFLDLVTKVFAVWSKDAWQILTAVNTGKAISIIQDQMVNLVVIDLHMPGVDGLQFLRLLHRKYPHLPKVILTGDISEDMKKVCLANGAELHLIKPTSIEGMENVYAALNEISKQDSTEGLPGGGPKIGFQELVQLECLNRHSSILEISAGTERGQVFIKDGAIQDARCGDLSGRDAFFALMALNASGFNLKPYAAPPATTIQEPWEKLLADGSQKLATAAGQAAPNAKVSDPRAEPAPPTVLNPKTSPLPPRPQAPVFDPAASANARAMLAPAVEEMLLCSSRGEVLYEWQCSSAESRMKLFEFLGQRTAELSRALPFGNFERMEMHHLKARVICQLKPDSRLLVRSQRGKL